MKENQNQCQFPPFIEQTDTTSLSCPTLLHSTVREQQQERNELLPVQGSISHPLLHQTNDDNNQYIGDEHAQSSVKLMSSKMRLMGSQTLQAQSSSIVRVCSDCNTTKTPLWRSGPRGPRSLCNACGIRQMKARRALIPAEEKRSGVDRTVPFKKRFKVATPRSAQKKLRFDDVTVSSSKKLAFHQAFPQEEKDAAILLMALSCGLIHG